MALKLVTPPSAEPVSLDELKEHLCFTDDLGTADDAMLTRKIAAARQHVERMLGQSLIDTTFDLFLDRFPRAEIGLPRGPLRSVVDLAYIGLDGIEATVSAANYAVDTVSSPGWVVPHTNVSWPQTMETVNAVRVRFVAGYSDTPSGLPEALKEAVRQLAA